MRLVPDRGGADQRIGQQLRALLERPDADISLAEAALLVASREYPDLAPAPYLQKLDQMAASVTQPVEGQTDPFRIISEVNRYLFEVEGFSGNTRDYADPRNSYLNDVLDRKTGIPIMLSTVYLEVAARLRFPLVGVGMPGHFLVKHAYFNILIDPFSRGAILSEADCEKRMKQVLGESVPFHSSYLAGVSKKHTVTRMLNNLRNVFVDLRQFGKALQMAELILALHPDSADDIRQKAAFLIELRRYPEAAATLERYLHLVPEADDAEEMQNTVRNLRRTLAHMN
jgi:regulator of sirC expression with transglutaminase-like and TPR domain